MAIASHIYPLQERLAGLAGIRIELSNGMTTGRCAPGVQVWSDLQAWLALLGCWGGWDTPAVHTGFAQRKALT
eukprot:1160223-Pelagomonas_calceolata.AAC.7